MQTDKVCDAIVRRVESEIGHRLFAEAISLLANEEESTWSIADRFGLSLYTVRLLRDRPFMCMRYIFKQWKGQSLEKEEVDHYRRPGSILAFVRHDHRRG